MKKPINYLVHFIWITCVLCLNEAIAQNGSGTGPTWHTGGNNIDEAIHFIGTVNNSGFIVKTDLMERARVTATGRLGLGTSIPDAKFMLVGEDDLPGTTALHVVSNSLNSLFHIKNGGNIGIGTTSPVAKLTIIGSGNTHSTEALHIMNSSSNTLFSIKDNGNTGIKTDSPQASLQIHSGQDADLDYTTGAGYLIIGNPDGTNIAIDNNEIMARNRNNLANPAYSATLHLQADGGGLRIHNNMAEANKVVIDNEGNVGIGTANPTTNLDIHGVQSFAGIVGDKISLFDDRINMSNMYGLGVATGTLYYKSNGSHKWYSQTNPGTGNPFMTLASNGFLGLGTENPNVNLTVEGPNARLVLRDNAGNNSENAARIELVEFSNGNFNDGAFFWWNGDADKLFIGTKDAGTNENIMIINRSGLNVGIGTQNPDNNYRLAVNGKIRAKEVVVETGWSDFVFEEDYELSDLFAVEDFIKANKHLPGIPSAAEIAQNGVSLGEMDSKLLLKIEELTLYLIEIKKENVLLKQRLDSLENEAK
jgi:hypothetical protein